MFCLHGCSFWKVLRDGAGRSCWLSGWLVGWLSVWLVGWLSGWLVVWLIGWLVDWLSGWLVDWLAGWLIDWLVDWLVVWLIGWLIGCLVDWLSGWLVAWLIGCLAGWLVGWLVDWLGGWLFGIVFLFSFGFFVLLLFGIFIWGGGGGSGVGGEGVVLLVNVSSSFHWTVSTSLGEREGGGVGGRGGGQREGGNMTTKPWRRNVWTAKLGDPVQAGWSQLGRERKVPGSNPDCAGIFSGSSHTSDLKIGTPVATLPGAWRYRVSAGTGRPGVSILWLGEMESLICSFYLGVAARKIACADPSLRYTRMLQGR